MEFTIYDLRFTSQGKMGTRLTRPSAIIFLLVMLATALGAGAQTTQVLFPVNTLFGGAAYNKPITITAANKLITDGQNLWAGTYVIIPASTTNPVVGLYPNTYLMTVAGVVRAARFVVPASTNVLNVNTLLTSGPLFYFGTNGPANLLASTNILFVTNADGSISISATGGGSGNPAAAVTNLPNVFSVSNSFSGPVTGSNANFTAGYNLNTNGNGNFSGTISANSLSGNGANVTNSVAVDLFQKQANGASISSLGHNGWNITDADGSSAGLTGAGINVIWNPASAIDPFKVTSTNNTTLTELMGNGNISGQLFTGNGGGFTNIPAASLTGTISPAQLPGSVVTNNNSGASGQSIAGTNLFMGSVTVSNNVTVTNGLTVLGHNSSVSFVGLTNGVVYTANVLQQNGFGSLSLGFSGLTSIDTLYDDPTYGLFGIGYKGLGGGFAGQNANIVLRWANNLPGSTNDLIDIYTTNGATASPLSGITSNGMVFAQGFSGNGALLTTLTAANLSGVVPAVNLPGGTYTNSFQPTNPNLSVLAAGNGGGLTNIINFQSTILATNPVWYFNGSFQMFEATNEYLYGSFAGTYGTVSVRCHNVTNFLPVTSCHWLTASNINPINGTIYLTAFGTNDINAAILTNAF